MRGSSQALPRRSMRRLFVFGTLPSMAGSLKRTSDIARTWLMPTTPSLSSSVLRQTSGDGRASVDGGGAGATAATCGRAPVAGGADAPEAAVRALPGAVAAFAAALAAGAPTRTSAQPTFIDTMRSGPTISKSIGFARLSPGMASNDRFGTAAGAAVRDRSPRPAIDSCPRIGRGHKADAAAEAKLATDLLQIHARERPDDVGESTATGVPAEPTGTGALAVGQAPAAQQRVAFSRKRWLVEQGAPLPLPLGPLLPRSFLVGGIIGALFPAGGVARRRARDARPWIDQLRCSRRERDKQHCSNCIRLESTHHGYFSGY